MFKLLLTNIFTKDDKKKHLLSKLQLLLSSIPDRTLRDLIYKNCFFAGGCIRDLFVTKTIKDYDIFFKSEGAYEEIHHRLRKIAPDSRTTFTVLYESIHTYTIKVGSAIFQFCKSPYVGTPNDVISKFDYTNCMAYYNISSNELIGNDQFFKAVENKKLVYNKDAYNPAVAVKRYSSFIEDGWEADSSFDYHAMLTYDSGASKRSSSGYSKEKDDSIGG